MMDGDLRLSLVEDIALEVKLLLETIIHIFESTIFANFWFSDCESCFFFCHDLLFKAAVDVIFSDKIYIKTTFKS